MSDILEYSRGMQRSTVLILAIDIYGITAAVLAILGILRTPIIIIPFILTPFIIDPLHKLIADPRYRFLSFAIIAILVIATILLVYLVLTSLT